MIGLCGALLRNCRKTGTILCGLAAALHPRQSAKFTKSAKAEISGERGT